MLKFQITLKSGLHVLQAPATTDSLPEEFGDLAGAASTDPAADDEADVPEVSDHEDEFGECPAEFLNPEKMDCPKASFASGECHGNSDDID